MILKQLFNLLFFLIIVHIAMILYTIGNIYFAKPDAHAVNPKLAKPELASNRDATLTAVKEVLSCKHKDLDDFAKKFLTKEPKFVYEDPFMRIEGAVAFARISVPFCRMFGHLVTHFEAVHHTEREMVLDVYYTLPKGHWVTEYHASGYLMSSRIHIVFDLKQKTQIVRVYEEFGRHRLIQKATAPFALMGQLFENLRRYTGQVVVRGVEAVNSLSKP